MTTATTKLAVQMDELTLDVGTVVENGTLDKSNDKYYTIIPPGAPLFEQVVHWLDEKPKQFTGASYTDAFATGFSSLCFRWGTWLAFPTDDSKPVNPNVDKSASALSIMMR